ncbi:hypothetical protein GV764_16445 [Atlantibacter hermannii]|nr:hypothetical protein [Atlantibacter hermannii]NBD00598.1 hypothetical protein [Atlantibacter hermannii]
MPIPKRRVAIELFKTEPSRVQISELQRDLRALGLTCSQTESEKLQEFKKNVISKWPVGKSQSWGIYSKNQNNSPRVATNSFEILEKIDTINLLDHFGYSDEGLNGSWTPSDTAMGYRNELFCIQFPIHFNKLKTDKAGSFSGVEKSVTEYSTEGTAEKIKNFFVSIGKELSGSIVAGLDKDALEPVLKNAIGINESDLNNDYETRGERVIYLVQNYNETTQEADAIGVVAINWKLKIKNYTEKKTEKQHKTTLEMQTRSILYSDLNVLINDYEYIKNTFKNILFFNFNDQLDNIPSRKVKLKVFDKKPLACKNTFLYGLPVLCKSLEYIDSIILHTADIERLQVLDNEDSDATSEFSLTITESFSFSSSISLTAGLTFEADFQVAKIGLKFESTVSFSEESTQSVSKTYTITAPPRNKVFAFRAYLNASILRYFPGKNEYVYIDHSKYLTNILKTTDKDIIID